MRLCEQKSAYICTHFTRLMAHTNDKWAKNFSNNVVMFFLQIL